MTCIVGMVSDGKVYIGADSASISDWERRKTALSKVFQRGEFLIGYTSSFRMGQLLEHYLDVRPPEEGESDMAYMVRGFADAARLLFKEHGFAKIENNEELGGVFMVGYRGHLYLIDSDYQVQEHADGLDACGAGQEYALGAMLCAQGEPEQRIRQALAAAAYFSAAVCEPFRVMSL